MGARIFPGCKELEYYLKSILPLNIKDYCPNGLQIEGKRPVRKIVSGVTATVELLDAAKETGADALLVHHGLFWKGDSPCLVGWRRERIEAFLDSGISLLAYHLPLDVHVSYGNNAQLAGILDIHIAEEKAEQGLIWYGRFKEAIEEAAIESYLENRLNHKPLIIKTGRAIQQVAWCTGGAQRYFEQAIDEAPFEIDAFITGEISEQNVHLAHSTGVTFIAAGHHATERYGVQAICTHLADYFNIEHEFIDCPSPV
ncbi:MAG: Nif3-like dinuclear metal center hexameric protein [Pseudomonadota bacterium]